MNVIRPTPHVKEATARLAGWCANAPRDWSAACLDGARRAFVDTVAVMVAGQHIECTTGTRKAVAPWGAGPCHVFGGGTLAAPWAALVNGTSAHALDYDDVLNPAMSHPSAALVPAILALAEERGGSGADCLDAYLIGFEVLARLGESMNLVHYQRGWHTTLSLGSMGVAASCARMMGLDARGMQMAISLATSVAGGSKRQFGSMAKPLHAGLAAKNGLMAAQLAANGVTGIDEPLQGRWGYLELMAGETAPGFDKAFAKLGSPPAMEEYGVWAKFYPCCASTHRPVDAIRSMGLKPEQIAKIEADISEVSISNLRYRVPRNPNEARFSLPYCLAAVLEDGMLTVGSFSGAAVTRAALVPLMERVELRLDPELKADRAVTESIERGTVTVTLKDGRVLKEAVLTPRGHPGAPLSDDDLAQKFRDCAKGLMTEAKIAEALDLLARFGELPAMAPLMKAVAA